MAYEGTICLDGKRYVGCDEIAALPEPDNLLGMAEMTGLVGFTAVVYEGEYWLVPPEESVVASDPRTGETFTITEAESDDWPEKDF